MDRLSGSMSMRKTEYCDPRASGAVRALGSGDRNLMQHRGTGQADGVELKRWPGSSARVVDLMPHRPGRETTYSFGTARHADVSSLVCRRSIEQCSVLQ